MPKGYWVVRANIHDQDEYYKYVEKASEIVKKNSGTFLVRGGMQKEYEIKGYKRTVIVEFDSYQKAIDCYNSEEYQSALKHVENSANRIFTVVEGV